MHNPQSATGGDSAAVQALMLASRAFVGLTGALTAFAEAAGEMPEQEWWLGWGRNSGEVD